MDTEDLEAIIAGLRDVRVDDETLKMSMRRSVQEYNQKAQESNLRLLRECVDAVAAADLETEQEKLNRIAHLLFAMETWGQDENFSTDPQDTPKRVGDYGWPPERLDQVLGLPQLHKDCTNPPFTEEFSTMLVEEMASVVFGGHTEFKVAPRELLAFFRCVSGVCDLNYNRVGLCAFESPTKEGVTREEMHETIVDKNRIPRFLSTEASDVLEKLDVLGGFRFGWSFSLCRLDPVDQWQSFYLFCRPRSGGDNNCNADWSWRVVIHLDSDGDEGIVAPVKIFETIPDFLKWYGSWYDRFDREQFLEDLIEVVEFS